MTDRHEKGDALERAVREIEETILKEFPGYNDKTFRIERRKVIVVAGVRHEIDIWVEVDLGKGYRSLFIFECKNWEEKVGKNEIVIFSSKIAVACAQQGFFVARAYTRDAGAQAKADPRLRLLLARDLPEEAFSELRRLHVVGIDRKVIKVKVAGCRKGAGPTAFSIPVEGTTALLAGIPVVLADYSKTWVEAATEEYFRTYPSHTKPEGVYEVCIEDTRIYEPGELVLGEISVLKATLTIECAVHVHRPKITSAYEVATRGRAAIIAPIEVPGGQISMTISSAESVE